MENNKNLTLSRCVYASNLLRDKLDKFFLSIALAYWQELITIEQVKEILDETFPTLDFSNSNKIYFVGDGTYLEFSDKYVEIRKSGTDAIIKCYSSGIDRKVCINYAKTLVNFDGVPRQKFIQYSPKETYSSSQKIGLDMLREFQREIRGYLDFNGGWIRGRQSRYISQMFRKQ